MNAAAKERLWEFRHAWDSGFVRDFVVFLALVIVPIVIWILQSTKRIATEQKSRERVASVCALENPLLSRRFQTQGKAGK
jgi:hypothetical protein